MIFRLLMTLGLFLSSMTLVYAQAPDKADGATKAEKKQSTKNFFKMSLPGPKFLLKFEADLSLSSKQVDTLKELASDMKNIKLKKKDDISKAFKEFEATVSKADATEAEIKKSLKVWQDMRSEVKEQQLLILIKSRLVLNADQREKWLSVANKRKGSAKDKKGKHHDDADQDKDDDHDDGDDQ
jgi:hypothetical protein